MSELILYTSDDGQTRLHLRVENQPRQLLALRFLISYTLSAELYRAKGETIAYTRQVAFSSVQHPEMVLNYVSQHGRIQRAEVMALCHLTPDQAKRLLKSLKDEDRLVQHGERRGSYYTLRDA